MAKHARQSEGATTVRLEPCLRECWECQGPLWTIYYKTRMVVTLGGLRRLVLQIRRCVNPDCPRYRQCYRPEGEGAFALPHAEVGLEVIARVGALRFAEHRSIPEIHRDLQAAGVAVGERTVTHLLARYEELLTLHLADREALQQRLRHQGGVILALDGLQPDVGHEVLWVLRDVLSGEVLLARSLLSAAAADLAALLEEVQAALPVPIRGVISDGQHAIRNAVKTALPGVPHQLCQFHYLRDAALPIYEADRHAKKELKKRVRGIRPIERRLEPRLSRLEGPHPAGPDAASPPRPAEHGSRGAAAATEATPAAATEAVRGYCLAVRSALTDDGRPPLAAAGLQLRERLAAIQASAARVVAGSGAQELKKGGRSES
jgi:hypothetical protein